MSTFVIDANVVIGMLISAKAFYRPPLVYHDFVLPVFALEEIERYAEVVKKKTILQPTEFFEWSYFVFSQLTFLPQYMISPASMAKAEKLLAKIDVEDVNYLALALELKVELLTRDKPLYTGLRKQRFRKVKMFDEFSENIINK